jgi:hypothetical protein
MRSATRLGVLVLLPIALVACDSEQPAQVEVSLASINIQAVNASAKSLDVWTMIEDNDGDGFPDDGEKYLWCEGPTVQSLNPNTVPWPFSAQISVIRNGTITKEVITSEAAAEATFNIADYDRQSGQQGGSTPSDPPFACSHDSSGIPSAGNKCTSTHQLLINGRVFQFSSPRRWPAVRESLMNDTGNPLATLLGSGFGKGICTVGTPGEARLDSVPLPYTLELNKGDTIIVEARMSTSPLQGSGLSQLLVLNPSNIAGSLRIDGRRVNVQGQTSGDNVSFSFTLR